MRKRAGGPGGYRSALRSRDLRLLLGSQLVSATGSWAYNTALIVLLYQLTHSAGWVAAGTMARYLPCVVFSGYGGVIAERFERVRLMVWLNVIALTLQAVTVALRVAILERLDLFQSATRSSLETLAGAAKQIAVPAGTVLIAEGDQANAFYVLTEGRLDVSAIGEAGTQPVHLRTLEPVSYAGEIGLLGHMPRTAGVTARSRSKLLRIGGEDFLDALTSLSASPSLLEGARARLALTHPSTRVLEPLLHGHGVRDAGEAASPDVMSGGPPA